MSDNTLVDISLKAFSEEGHVQTEEQIYVLTSHQLQEIIDEATKSLKMRVEALEGRIVQLEGDKAKIEDLEKDQITLSENQLIQLRLINDLRKDHGPQPLQRDRSEILRALLVANGGKMLAKEARQKMRMSKQAFTNLLAVLPGIESKPHYTDKRKRVLFLK